MVLYPQCLSGCSEFACLAWFRRHARGSRMAFQSGRAVGPGGDVLLAHRARHSAPRLAGGRYGGSPPTQRCAPPAPCPYTPRPPCPVAWEPRSPLVLMKGYSEVIPINSTSPLLPACRPSVRNRSPLFQSRGNALTLPRVSAAAFVQLQADTDRACPS